MRVVKTSRAPKDWATLHLVEGRCGSLGARLCAPDAGSTASRERLPRGRERGERLDSVWGQTPQTVVEGSGGPEVRAV